MIGHMLYIVGAPGVGKSTVTTQLTARWDRIVHPHAPVPHSVLRHPVTGRRDGLELGVPRPDFPGTDALSMSIGPRALQFVLSRTSLVPFALGEGSRLATQPFIGGLARAGVAVTLVRLAADEDLLTERWKMRGSKQNPIWRKGAGTRATRLADWFSDGLRSFPSACRYLDLDVTESQPHETADRIRDFFPLVDLRESAA